MPVPCVHLKASKSPLLFIDLPTITFPSSETPKVLETGLFGSKPPKPCMPVPCVHLKASKSPLLLKELPTITEPSAETPVDLENGLFGSKPPKLTGADAAVTSCAEIKPIIKIPINTRMDTRVFNM